MVYPAFSSLRCRLLKSAATVFQRTGHQAQEMIRGLPHPAPTRLLLARCRNAITKPTGR